MSKDIKYKEVKGTSYHVETPSELVSILEIVRALRKRIKFHYGDTKTGRDWNEEYDTAGYIGRSTGNVKIPLLIKTSRSLGGGAILDHCIIKVIDAKTKEVLYQHKNYQVPIIEIVPSDMAGYSHNTIVNGKLHGRHKTLKSAERLKSKLLV